MAEMTEIEVMSMNLMSEVQSLLILRAELHRTRRDFIERWQEFKTLSGLGAGQRMPTSNEGPNVPLPPRISDINDFVINILDNLVFTQAERQAARPLFRAVRRKDRGEL